MPNYIEVLTVTAAYLLGNLSPAYLMTRFKTGHDIRTLGSGNAGSTNILRVLGKRAAAGVLLIDVAKGMLGVGLGFSVGGRPLAVWCGAAVVLGHIFPALLGFKGGKGVATTLGVALVLFPLQTFWAALIGIGVILWKKIVSLGALIGFGVHLLLVALSTLPVQDKVMMALLTAVVYYAHRANVVRIVKGQEKKIGEKAKVKV